MTIRDQLVQTVLEWEERFGFFPGQAGITAAVSEYDAAIMYFGLNEDKYIASIQDRGPVGSGYDFMFKNKKIQVKANRPGRRPGAAVWNVGPKVKTDGWDILIYILYDEDYVIQEAYQFDSQKYEDMFSGRTSLRLDDMRKGTVLLWKGDRVDEKVSSDLTKNI